MSKRISYLVITLLLLSAGCTSKTPAPNAALQEQGQSPAQANTDAPEKFGLLESTRKQIAEESFKAFQDSYRSAQQKYPTQITDIIKNRQRYQEMSRKREEMSRSLWQNSIQELTTKYNLTRLQLEEIRDEGVDKGWMKYPELPTDYK
jgi:hypothetical protein